MRPRVAESGYGISRADGQGDAAAAPAASHVLPCGAGSANAVGRPSQRDLAPGAVRANSPVHLWRDQGRPLRPARLSQLGTNQPASWSPNPDAAWTQLTWTFIQASGAADRNRTRNLLFTKQLLCQLSYGGLDPIELDLALFPTKSRQRFDASARVTHVPFSAVPVGL
jgi:hypothetical protein